MISKRLYLNAAWLTAVCRSLPVAFAQEDAPEKPVANQPAEEANDEPVDSTDEASGDDKSEEKVWNPPHTSQHDKHRCGYCA